MRHSGLTLVCFAVKEEAAGFRRLSASHSRIRICVTGMGQQNAERSFLSACEKQTPDLVITSGFAGALRPELPTGTVVFDADPESGLKSALAKAGAQVGRFVCAERVAVTAKEKHELLVQSGADAVEMESQIIRAHCAGLQIPSATVRVILDTADQDLPIDFNRLMNHKHQIRMRKLLWQLARSPRKIAALLRFQKQCQTAARLLAEVLNRVFLAKALP